MKAITYTVQYDQLSTFVMAAYGEQTWNGATLPKRVKTIHITAFGLRHAKVTVDYEEVE